MTLRSIIARLRRGLGPALRDPRGATAVEYGLIVAMIVIVMIVALRQVATANTDIWSNVSDKVIKAN